jgi:signal transduction histidine kinase
LLSVSMQMAVANTKLADADPVKRDFASLLASLRQVAEESRNAVRGLRRLTARAETLADALSHISQDLATDSRTDLRVRVEGEPHSLKPYVQEELYLIAREAIANAFRHAEATEIDATVRYSLDWLVVSIRDNGVGIGREAAVDGRLGHFGLRGMRERATRIGAKLRVTSAPGAGTDVEVFVPAALAFESAAQSRMEAWLGRRRVAQSIGE